MLFLHFLLPFANLGACSRLSEALEFDRSAGALAPFYESDSDSALPDEFGVLFQSGYTLEQHLEFIDKDLSTTEGFERFGFGYVADLSNNELRDEVRRDPGVLGVERTVMGYLIDEVASSDIQSNDAMDEETEDSILKRGYQTDTDEAAPYGLQMLASGGKLTTPVKNFGRYDYVKGAGAGVNVYVLDSGIRTSLSSFGGRARHFGGLSSTDKSPYCQDTMDDVAGHGTHVAGIIGGRVVGVAPHANLVNVKVANNQRAINPNKVAQALLDVTAEHDANKARNSKNFWRFRGSVINMSFGQISESMILLHQIVKAERAGIKMYAAAGNNDTDAGSQRGYPCAYPDVSCIAAVDNSYEKAWFSNYGDVVDFLAPGQEVLSLGLPERDPRYIKKDGTSQATAYASGAAAIFTSWLGLVSDQTHHFADSVWWNSLGDKTSGFDSNTKNLLVNTGIHSKKKYPNEPFRWARDYPSEPQMLDDDSLTAAAAPGAISSTTFSTAVIGSSTGVPFDTASALSELATVTFSFDPTSSSVPSATAA